MVQCVYWIVHYNCVHKKFASIYIYIKGCCLVRDIDYGWKDTAFYFLAPFNFLLAEQLPRNVRPTDQKTASAPEEQYVTMRNQTKKTCGAGAGAKKIE